MAKLRYMIDYVFDEARFKRGEYPYVPCGVWAMSETQFEVGYLPGFEKRAQQVDTWLSELVENGIQPERVDGFLEFWRERRASFDGSFSRILEMASLGSVVECVRSVLAEISTPEK